MTLILLDAHPRGQVLINTDQISQARETPNGTVLTMTAGAPISLPHESVHRLYDAITEELLAQRS